MPSRGAKASAKAAHVKGNRMVLIPFLTAKEHKPESSDFTDEMR